MIKGKILDVNDNPIVTDFIGEATNPLDNEPVKILNSQGDVVVEYSGERVKFSLGDFIQEAIILINDKKDLAK